MEEFLRTLLATLNDIEVKGKQNMNLLLGAIMATEQELATLSVEESEGEIINEEADNG